MTAANSRGLAAVGCVLAGAGILYFLSATGVVPTKAGGLAIGIAALAVLIYLMRTIDPAWLLSAGIVGSMFAAHWDQLGVKGQDLMRTFRSFNAYAEEFRKESEKHEN